MHTSPQQMVLVHGTFCLDRILRVPRLPFGGYVDVIEETWGLGGEAANTAANLVRWGAPIRFVPNPIGIDDKSRRLEGLAARAGLPLDHLERRADTSAPLCEVYVTPDGERTMFGHGFSALANAPLESFDCSGCGWFTTDSNLGMRGVEALRYARAQGLYTVAMDYAHKPTGLPVADLHLTSLDCFTGDPRRWARETRQSLLLTLGIRGCVLCTPSDCFQFPAYPAPRVVDTTGAGDCFRAGVLYGLQQGWSLPLAVRFASAAAALSIGALGACGGIPTVEETMELVAQHPEVSAKFDEA